MFFVDKVVEFCHNKNKEKGMKEFFGFGGYQRTPEGYMSWQHLTFVTTLMLIMVGLAIFFGLRNKNKSDKVKNKVLIVAAILIDTFEIISENFDICNDA